MNFECISCRPNIRCTLVQKSECRYGSKHVRAAPQLFAVKSIWPFAFRRGFPRDNMSMVRAALVSAVLTVHHYQSIVRKEGYPRTLAAYESWLLEDDEDLRMMGLVDLTGRERPSFARQTFVTTLAIIAWQALMVLAFYRSKNFMHGKSIDGYLSWLLAHECGAEEKLYEDLLDEATTLAAINEQSRATVHERVASTSTQTSSPPDYSSR
jgi:hypothetical protein